MKKVTFICDCCKQELNSKQHIRLGAYEDGASLDYENSIRGRYPGRKLNFKKEEALHFCSMECFVRFLFGDETLKFRISEIRGADLVKHIKENKK